MKRSILILALASALSLAMCPQAWATDYYVNGSVTASGTGLSWAQAFKTINEAATASTPTNIFVAGGELPTPIVYAESTTVTVPDSVNLLGGFPPSGNPSPGDRDPARYVAIVDGQNTHNEVVAVVDNALSLTLVDGFTLTGGVHHGVKNGNNSQCQFKSLIVVSNGSGIASGAGIHCGTSGSFPDIQDCLFEDNHAVSGGGIYCPGDSTFRATRCRFIGNEAISGGAVLIEPESSPTFSEIPPKPLPSIISSTFTRNQFRHCYFQDNQATGGDGGAINFSGELYVISSQFVGNTATSGAGLECVFGSLLGVNLEFAFNVATGDGGAINFSRGCYLTLVNSMAHHNHATGVGGVIHADAMVRMHMVNITTAGNTAGNYPSFYATFTSGNCGNIGDVYLSLRNSIIWDNASPQWNSEISSVLDSDYNDLRSGAVGANDIDEDPMFVSETNLRLKHCSPCIDAGDTRRVAQDQTDVDADTRTTCGGCDPEDGGEFTPDLDFRRRVKDLVSAADVGLPADIDTCPRECDIIVDMGVYEFAYGDCLALGDMNQDASVNGLDIQIFTLCAVELSEGEPETCVCGDFNADGRVDVDDVPCFIELLLTGDTSCPGPDYFCDEPTPYSLKDCNGNGMPDANDIANGTSLDCNRNGVPDSCDLDPEDPDGNESYSLDVNGNDIPDECDPDCDNDSIPDAWAIAEELVADINANGIPDACDPDCDADGQPDDYELTHGADDCNSNGTPDSCEYDCNSNGVPDDCDVDPLDPDGDESVSEDCNENGIPDECDLERPILASFDCNDNQIPDECDIASSTSLDANTNDIPDECEEESLMGDGENMMGGQQGGGGGGEGGGEFDEAAAWEAFFEWYEAQVFGEESDWHTLSGSQRFERVMDELVLLGLPYARPW